MSEISITIPVRESTGLFMRMHGADGSCGDTKFTLSHNFGLGGGSLFIRLDPGKCYEIKSRDIMEALFAAIDKSTKATAPASSRVSSEGAGGESRGRGVVRET